MKQASTKHYGQVQGYGVCEIRGRFENQGIHYGYVTIQGTTYLVRYFPTKNQQWIIEK